MLAAPRDYNCFVASRLQIVLDNIVKACNDILPVHRGKILLGKRNVYPQKSWWFGCGGKMLPGETRVEATRRLLKRELAIVLPEGAATAAR